MVVGGWLLVVVVVLVVAVMLVVLEVVIVVVVVVVVVVAAVERGGKTKRGEGGVEGMQLLRPSFSYVPALVRHLVQLSFLSNARHSGGTATNLLMLSFCVARRDLFLSCFLTKGDCGM
jgi:hypothetical protein